MIMQIDATANTAIVNIETLMEEAERLACESKANRIDWNLIDFGITSTRERQTIVNDRFEQFGSTEDLS
jgi:hypothetical protein